MIYISTTVGQVYVVAYEIPCLDCDQVYINWGDREKSTKEDLRVQDSSEKRG